MVDVLVWMLLNGFFLYLTFGYYQLFWTANKERRVYFVVGWLILLWLMNYACYLLNVGNRQLQFISVIFIIAILTIASLSLHLGQRAVEEYTQLESRIKRLQIDSYARQYKEIERIQNETRRQRQELKNNYLVIETLARNKDMEGILDFIRDLYHKLTPESTKSRSGNMVVDAVLNHKMNILDVDGICFNLDLNIPSKLDVSEVVLCGVLGNALDNAIEACSRIPVEKRRIDISMKVEKKNLFIAVTNTFDGVIRTDSKGHILTRKGEVSNHGIGLPVIRQLLEKNNGSFEAVWDGDEFQLRIMLYHAI